MSESVAVTVEVGAVSIDDYASSSMYFPSAEYERSSGKPLIGDLRSFVAKAEQHAR